MFTLAPQEWELAADRPLVLPTTELEFPFLWQGERVRWQVQLRPSPFDERQLTLYLRHEREDAGFWATRPFDAKLQPFQIRLACADLINKHKLTRVFFLDKDGALRRQGQQAAGYTLMGLDGIGTWNVRLVGAKWNLEATARFWLSSGAASLRRRDALSVWSELEQARVDERSDAHFAWRWAHLSEGERDDLLWNWPREEASRAARSMRKLRLEECLKLVLLREETLWQRSDDWVLSVRDAQSITLHPGDAQWEEHEISEAMSESIALLWERFKPFNPGALSHECARDWKRQRDVRFQTFAREPSAHERLEAMMRWRDFEGETA
jgi:hypothetical protein